MSEEGSAQRAFDDLRAEISVLRRSVEALPQAWRENRPPDYTEDLARVVKAMNTVGTHMEAIEASPTLKMTPQAYGKGIREAGLAVSQEMQAAFEKAIAEVQRERQELAHIIGQSRDQERQSWWLLGVGLVCFMVGLGASPVLTSLLPSSVGTRVASFIVGEKDRWHSGAMMMEIDNPEGWQQVIQASQLVEANKDRITACQKAASSLEKGQKNCSGQTGMICLRVRFDILQEFIRGCFKAAGQFEQGDDRRVTASFFQTAEILLTEARTVCNLFLRQATLFAQMCC